MEDQAQFLRDLVGMRHPSPSSPGGSPPSLEGDAWFIALASGLARAGRSSLCRNLASVFSRKGYRVFLVDGSDEAKISGILASRDSRNLSASGGKGGLASGAAGTVGMTMAFAPSGAGRASPPQSRDLLIVDLPAGVSHISLRVIRAADEPVVLALPGASGLREAAGFINLLSSVQEYGIPTLRLAVNCVDSIAEGRNTALAVMKACAPGPGAPVVEYRGCVFTHPERAAMGSGPEDIPLVESEPGSRTALSLVHFAERLERGRQPFRAKHARDNDARIVSELDGGSGLSLL